MKLITFKRALSEAKYGEKFDKDIASLMKGSPLLSFKSGKKVNYRAAKDSAA